MRSVVGGASDPAEFNLLGQLSKRTDPDGVVTLFGYNLKGEQEYTCLDTNLNNTIDYSGIDRISPHPFDRKEVDPCMSRRLPSRQCAIGIEPDANE